MHAVSVRCLLLAVALLDSPVPRPLVSKFPRFLASVGN